MITAKEALKISKKKELENIYDLINDACYEGNCIIEVIINYENTIFELKEKEYSVDYSDSINNSYFVSWK